MIRYMLDTSSCIDALRRPGGMTEQRLHQCEEGSVALSAITLAELMVGLHKSPLLKRNQGALAKFAVPFVILPFGRAAAVQYGRTRAALEQAGTPIGPLDTLIAAHALSVGAVLVTANEKEFCRVPRLTVENWTRKQ